MPLKTSESKMQLNNEQTSTPKNSIGCKFSTKELNQPKELVWLTVGGCPRSGTTALGAALSQNSEISLLHEYDSAKFWGAINNFFTEELRHQQHGNFNEYANMIPSKKRDSALIAQSVVNVIFKKNSHIIGTKFPGIHLWPKPDIPEGVITKEICITRNPFDTVLSYAKKNIYDGLYTQDQIEQSADEALAHWMSAYNYAVSRYQDSDFFHIFYDETIIDSKIYEAKLAEFLGVDTIDLSILQAVDSDKKIKLKFKSAGLSSTYEKIKALFSYNMWFKKVRNAMKNEEYIVLNNSIYFGSRDINHSYTQYITKGFYPAENDGIWTKGNLSSIRFKPATPIIGQLLLSIDIKWAVNLNNEWPLITIYLNNKKLADLTLQLHTNGVIQRYSFVTQDVDSSIIDIKLTTHNPRNPKKLGVSEDDRELAFMIQSVSVASI